MIYPHPDEVRQLVCELFLRLGAEYESVQDLSETILVEDGSYRARSYRTDDLFATWLVPVGVLQAYDAQGNMLATINLPDAPHPHRMMAA